MRRRRTQTSFRFRSLLVAGLVIVLAAALSACDEGSSTSPTPSESATPSETPSPSATPTASSGGTTRVFVYFLRGEKLGVAERMVPRTAAAATAAVRELCAGPTADEQAAGLSNSVPSGTELLGIEIRDGVAYVDLSSEYEGGGGALSMTSRVAQVVYTVTQFKTVKSVRFLLDGEAIEALGGEGVIISSPQKRADWVDFEPRIFVEYPAVGSELQSPFALRGTASVFEGSFLAELRDDSNRRLARVVVQATEGAPGRGTFRKVVRFTTAAERGKLIVYHISMEDGSRLDEVRIPVSFSR